nr:ribonuclease H-like domain-containing protein [Tanacetum cinerariifolium]
ASEGLHKWYNRFQTLLSQLKIHGAGILHEDANQKFLRSLPSSWSQVALIMKTKPGLDTLSFDDLYNNLRVFKRDVKGTTVSSSSNTQNVAFVSSDNTSNTSDINDDDMIEMDLKWQVAMISMRIKKFHKRTGRKLQFDTNDPVGFDKTKVECFNCHKIGHFPRGCRAKGNQDSRRRDVGYNGNKAKDNDAQNYDMMAYSSSNSGSDNESVFMNKKSDLEYTSINDRYAKGMHAVPPLMTGNYMPSGPDVEIDYSKFTYGPKQTSVDESDSKPSEYASCESDSSVDTTTSMPEPVENALKLISKPKVWTDTPIIEEYESDRDNDLVSNVQEDKEKPSFAFTDSIKNVKTSRENVKETCTPNHIPKVEKQDRNGHTRKGLGYAFTRKACFDDPHRALKNKGIVDSRCSRHMTGNKAHLADYQEFKGGFVAFRGSNGRITGKGKMKPGKLDFEDVYYVEELNHYNLFSVSQMCDNKNKVLFTNIDCLVLSPDFKLLDENQVLLNIPRQHNMYSFNLKNIDPSRDLACLFVKALIDESNKWHRRRGHVNFKNLNKLVKGNLVREEVNTACYVFNRVLVTKPQNKTPYELLTGKQSIISYLRPFGCHVTILNTIDKLGKFDGKSDSGFLVGYSLHSKAFRVYNLETKRVKENLHINFLENKPNVTGKGHVWMFDLDYLTNSMNYEPVSVENQANKSTGPKEANNSARIHANDDQGANSEETDLHKEHFVLPIWSAYSTTVNSSGDKIEKTTDAKPCKKPVSQVEKIFLEKLKRQEKEANDATRKETTHENQNAHTNSTNLLNTVSTPLSDVGPSRALNDDEPSYPDDPSMLHLEDIYASLIQLLKLEYTPFILKLKFLEILYFPFGKKAIRTKWVYRKKKDDRIESIRIFLAFASYMGFIVYQMDMKSAFLSSRKKMVSLLVKIIPSFDLEAYLDSDYAGVNLDRKSTTGEYVATAHCCGQVLWIENQLLDYGFNIMNTKIYIDNESTICIVKNLVFHSKTKHIEIRHHFIRDAYEKKFIQVLKIHIDDNVVDLLTKPFDVSSNEALAILEQTATEDVIRQALHLDDVDGVECLPNEEIFTELARMGYKKPPSKLTFYKDFFSAQWKFLIHTLIQCVSATRTAWNEFSCSMASAIICLATGRKFNFSKYIFDSMVRNVDSPSKLLMYPLFLQVIINAQVEDLSSHTNHYTSLALTQKVFANMRRIDDVEVTAAPTPPSPSNVPSPPPQNPIPTPLQAQPATPSSPPQEQLTETFESSMTLLNTLMETCSTLSQKVFQLEQDKIAQALEIFKLKKRVKKLKKKRISKSSVDVELQGRKDDDNAATKDVSAVEPTMFDDEEVTMTMAQTLIKMKVEKARLLDEQMAKILHDEEVEQAAARKKQEKDDLEKAKVLQKQYEDKQENIDWNTVVEKI